MKNRAMAVAGLLSVVGAAGAWLGGAARAADDKTYTLAPKYTLGEVVKYKMKSNINMEMTTDSGQSPFPGGEMVMNMAMKYKTTKVDENGLATVVMTMNGGEMTFMGQNMPMPETPAITMQVDKRGLSKQISGLDKLPGGQNMMNMFNFSNMPSSGFFYPDHPVKVGDKWDAELPAVMGSGSRKMSVSSEFLGVDTVDGKEVYKVKQTWIMPMEMMIGQGGPTKNPDEAVMVMSGDFTSAGTVLLAADTGRISKLSSDVKGKMIMEMKGAAAAQAPFKKMDIKMDGKSEMGLTGIGTAADEPEEKKPAAAPAKKPAPKATGTKRAVKKP